MGGGAIKKGSNQLVLEEGELAIELICLLSGDMRCFLKKQLSNPLVCASQLKQLGFLLGHHHAVPVRCDRSAGWAPVNLQCIISPLKHPSNAKSLFILQNRTVCLPCVYHCAVKRHSVHQKRCLV